MPVMNYQSCHHGTCSVSKTDGVRDVKTLRFHELCKATAGSYACLCPLSWFHELCKATAASCACLCPLSWFHELCKATAGSYARLRPLCSLSTKESDSQLCIQRFKFIFASVSSPEQKGRRLGVAFEKKKKKKKKKKNRSFLLPPIDCRERGSQTK